MEKMTPPFALGIKKMVRVMVIIGVFIICLSSVSGLDCYQESTNVSTACGGLNTGTYDWTASWVNVNATYDGDWNTFGNSALAYMFSNYTKPTNAVGAIVQFKTGFETINLTIPNDCWSFYDSILRIIITSNAASGRGIIGCQNYSLWVINSHELYRHTGGGAENIYEEGIYWNMTSLAEIEQNYDNPTHEMLNATFSITYNISGTTNPSATFRFNNVDYSPNTTLVNGEYAYFNVTIKMPVENTTTTRFFNWTISSGGYTVTSSTKAITEINTISTRYDYENISFMNSTGDDNYNWTYRFIYLPLDIPFETINIKLNFTGYNTSKSFPTLSTFFCYDYNAFYPSYNGGFGCINYNSFEWSYFDSEGLLTDLNNSVWSNSYWPGWVVYQGLSANQNRANADGGYFIPFYIADTKNGTIRYSDFFVTDQGFVEDAINYTGNVTETSNQTFLLTFDIIRKLYIDANFYYNGTKYPTKVNCGPAFTCYVNTTIDIPLINSGTQQNNTFFWSITTYNETGSYNQNSSVNTQTVNLINLTYCSAGTRALNFTAYDEQNRSRIRNYSFDSNFQYYTGSGSVYRVLNITNTNATEINICINLNTTFYIDSITAYSAPASTVEYPIRNYFTQRFPISNNTKHIPLYLLKSSSSTSFILQVENNYLIPLSNVLVEAQRCYPGLYNNETVFVHRTDSSGMTIGNIEAETGLYQFFITNYSRTLLAVTPCQKIVPQTTPYTLLFQVGSEYVSPFININDVTDLTSIIYYNVTTSNITLSYSDTSGIFNYTEFKVKSLNYTGNNQPILCDKNNTISTGFISCQIDNTATKSYFVEVKYYRTDGTIVYDYQTFNVSGYNYGYYGAFLGFFIILICVFMFKFNEIAGIWITVIACWFIDFVHLIDFGIIFLTAETLIAILITAILER